MPWVSTYDLASCAMHALADETPVNKVLFIKGPELLSHHDASIVALFLSFSVMIVFLLTER